MSLGNQIAVDKISVSSQITDKESFRQVVSSVLTVLIDPKM